MSPADDHRDINPAGSGGQTPPFHFADGQTLPFNSTGEHVAPENQAPSGFGGGAGEHVAPP